MKWEDHNIHPENSCLSRKKAAIKNPPCFMQIWVQEDTVISTLTELNFLLKVIFASLAFH